MVEFATMEPSIPPKYQRDIEIAKNLLKNEGCQSIYLFGSLVTGKYHDHSDIDIGMGWITQRRITG